MGRTIVVDIFKKERGEPQGTRKKDKKNCLCWSGPIIMFPIKVPPHPCSLRQRATPPLHAKDFLYIFTTSVPFPRIQFMPATKNRDWGRELQEKRRKERREEREGCDSTSDKAVWVSPKHWATIFSLSFTIRNFSFFLWMFVNSSW